MTNKIGLKKDLHSKGGVVTEPRLRLSEMQLTRIDPRKNKEYIKIKDGELK